MHTILRLATLLLVLHSGKTFSQIVDISVETDIYYYAKDIIGNRAILDVTDYSGINSQRDVVEFILVQHALLLGGSNISFNFIQGNYDARNLKLLNEGLLLLSFDTLWKSATEKYKQNLFISEPLIENGEYFAGLYVSEKKLKEIENSNSIQLSNFSIVSSRAWHVDWKTLQHLKPKKLLHESDWIVLAKMVSRGWVDGMLAPFKKQEKFSYIGPDYRIFAVPKVKVALEDSRHFVVSKNHPLGKQTFKALQKGLKILRERGLIKRAYRQSGFINNDVKNLRVLRK